MPNKTLTHDSQLETIFSAISESAERMSAPAFIVGGFVRDMILKRECKDIDIVVEGSGIELAEKVADLLNI
jgi:poly(A) polymerase